MNIHGAEFRMASTVGTSSFTSNGRVHVHRKHMLFPVKDLSEGRSESDCCES